jgi:hypothetical protein
MHREALHILQKVRLFPKNSSVVVLSFTELKHNPGVIKKGFCRQMFSIRIYGRGSGKSPDSTGFPMRDGAHAGVPALLLLLLFSFTA